MARTIARTALTLTTSMLLLAMMALPVLAAEGTKPDPTKNPDLVGSMSPGLVYTAIVGIVVGAIAFALRAPGPAGGGDHH